MNVEFTVITMPGNRRIERFRAQDPQGRFRIFSARDAQEVFGHFNQERFREIYGRPPRAGEAGCTDSHFRLQTSYRARWHCIVEDDAILNEAFSSVVSAIGELELSPAVVILGQSRTLSTYDWFTRLKQPLTNSFEVKPGLLAGQKNYINKFGTVGYMINRGASKVLSQSVPRPYWQADDWALLRNTFGLQVFHLDRLVVHEDLTGYKSTTGNGLVLRNDIQARPLFEIAGMLARRLQHLVGAL